MKKLMKAAVFHGRHDIKIENIPVPEIKGNEVLVKVAYCGVCGTDVHIFEGDKGCAEVHPPIVLGHEFAGEIVAVGDEVKDRKIGDRVDVDPNVLCEACPACLSAKGHFCEHMTGIGTMVNGGFAEYVAVPAKQTHLLSEKTDLKAAAMTEPLACCLHGIDMCDIRAGDKVLVIGGGMIGLLMLQLSRLSGAAFVAVSEPVSSKREQAKKLGADLCLAPCSVPSEQFEAECRKYNFNCVIECCGLTKTIEQAVRVAGCKATVMMFGLTKPDAAISLRPYDVFSKELTLRSSYINPYTQARALALIESGRIDVTSMQCPPVSLEELSFVLSDEKARAKGKFVVQL
ncbi:MAG: zinc-dependent alcohol dehydrogenase family protein [Christensenellaceae bacterium]